MGALVGIVTEAFGYLETWVAGLFGCCFLVFGLAGSFVHAVLLDRYKRYKL